MTKIIHYFYDDINIWQKNTSSQFRMCYASWLKFCPDYEIKLWHVDMPEFKQILKKSKFIRECYKRKYWSYIADYIRYYALYNYGGVYLDTDIQLLKNLDEFIDKPFFCSIEGDFYKRKNLLESALIGGEKGHQLFKEMLDIYESDKIFNSDALMAPIVLTNLVNEKYGFETIDYTDNYKDKAVEYYKNLKGYQLKDFDLYKNQKITTIPNTNIEIYPSEYFCPSWSAFGNDAFTEKTVAIHWNQSSWWKYSKSLKEVQALKYQNKFKRFWFMHSDHVAKMLTFAIPNKELRRKTRDFLTYK